MRKACMVQFNNPYLFWLFQATFGSFHFRHSNAKIGKDVAAQRLLEITTPLH